MGCQNHRMLPSDTTFLTIRVGGAHSHGMDTLPELPRLSEQAKDALIAALWAEVQRLRARVADLEATLHAPVKDARNSSVPSSKTRKATPPPRPPTGPRREASVGRAGGGRPLHPAPDQVVVAQAKCCPHCGQGVSDEGQSLQAVYDKSALPPVKPIVPRVEQYGGRCAGCGHPEVAPVPTGREPGPPLGASVQRLATDLRYTQAIRYERLAALLAQVFGLGISAGGLAHLCQWVKGRRAQRVAEILTRLRSRRWICRDETSARGNGRNQGQWGFQHAEVCLPVLRPSRGGGVIQEVLGAPRPAIWVSAL